MDKLENAQQHFEISPAWQSAINENIRASCALVSQFGARIGQIWSFLMTSTPPTGGQEKQLSDLSWLVKNRSKNQIFLFDLYATFCTLDKNAFAPNFKVPDLLLGAGFSLWRAVFLIGERGEKIIHDHGKQFLSGLVADNMIGYPQDKNSSAWTAGFYINNALYRIEHIYKALDKKTGLEEFAQTKSEYQSKIEKCIEEQTDGTDKLDLRPTWEIAQDAAIGILNVFPSDRRSNFLIAQKA